MDRKELMETLAKYLGVELEEEFLYGDNHTYKIIELGVRWLNARGEWNPSVFSVDQFLEFKVTKLPWKPKKGEEFYAINFSVHWDFKVAVDTRKHICQSFTKTQIENGNCFKTYEQAREFAEEKKIEIEKILKGG